MGQLQLDYLHCLLGSLPSRVFVLEEEVSAGLKGDRCDGTPRSQFSFIIPVFPDVITTIFVPVNEHKVEGLPCHPEDQMSNTL